jgi:hypothetical protein
MNKIWLTKREVEKIALNKEEIYRTREVKIETT